MSILCQRGSRIFGKRDKLLREHADDIALDKWMPREAWFVLKAKRPGVGPRLTSPRKSG